MKIGDYDTHPIADAFPLLQGAEFELLLLDIKDKGLLDRELWLYKGKILDGRNRYKACLELGIKPKWREYEGDDPIGFALSRNYMRRNMNESQRAIVVCRLATMKPGRPKKDRPRAEMTTAEAAAAAGVGERTVERARAVMKSGTPEVLGAIERGELDLKAAAELAKLPADQQRDALEQRRERVQRVSKKGQGEGDPIDRLLRAIMRTVHDMGASVKRDDAHTLTIGYQGEELALTLDRVS